MPVPDSVCENPGGEGIVRVSQPFCQLDTTAFGFRHGKVGGIEIAGKGGNTPGDFVFPGLIGVAANVNRKIEGIGTIRNSESDRMICDFQLEGFDPLFNFCDLFPIVFPEQCLH